MLGGRTANPRLAGPLWLPSPLAAYPGMLLSEKVYDRSSALHHLQHSLKAVQEVKGTAFFKKNITGWDFHRSAGSLHASVLLGFGFRFSPGFCSPPCSGGSALQLRKGWLVVKARKYGEEYL